MRRSRGGGGDRGPVQITSSIDKQFDSTPMEKIESPLPEKHILDLPGNMEN